VRLLRKNLSRKLWKFRYLQPTLYLTNPNKEGVPVYKKVEVLGNFTAQPWQTRIPCSFNRYFNAYTAVVRIKVGQIFKFVAEGNKYLCSDYYPQSKVKSNSKRGRTPKET